MKKTFTVFLCTLAYFFTGAQPVYHWMNQLGGVENDGGGYVAVDNEGNVYSASHIPADAFFKPKTTKEIKFIKGTSTASRNLIITKVDPVGNLIWAKQFGDNIAPTTVSVDKENNIIVAGTYFNTVDFDPSSSVYNLTSNNAADIFILKLNKNGDFLWAGSIGGKNGDQPMSLVTDNKSNIALICQISDTVDVDISPTTTFNLYSNSSFQGAVVKMNSSGKFLWGHHLKELEPVALGFDSSGNLFSTGYFVGTKDFDFSSGVFHVTSTGSAVSADAYVLKEDTSGKFIWVKSFGEFVNYDNPSCLVLDKKQNVIIAGRNGAGNSDFDPGPGTVNLVGNTNFILKLDNSGSYVWAKGFNGSSFSLTFKAIGVDDSGNVYTCGGFSSTVDFNPGSGISNLSPLTASAGNFLLKLDLDGSFRWVEQMINTNLFNYSSLNVDWKGNIYLGGTFSLKADFDLSSATKIDSSMGSSDVFTLKLSRCLSNSSLVLSECKHFELGGHRFDTSEIIDILFTAKDGCDSVVTVNVTVKKVNDTITAIGSTLSAKSLAGTSYQWVTCPSYTVIPGATSTTYVASTSGNYALMITENGCTDTSDCLYVTGLGIDEFSSNHQIKVYPNPAKDIVSIEGLEQGSSIKLLSIVGQEIASQTANGTQVQLSLKNLVPGLYLLQLETESGVVSTIKIVKE